MTRKAKAMTKTGLHALIWKEGDWFVSKCLEIELASQGRTKEEALVGLEEALGLYFEEEKVTIPQPLFEPRVYPLDFAYA